MSKLTEEKQHKLRQMLINERRRLWQKLRVDISVRLSDDYKAELDRGMDSGDQSVLDLLRSVGIKLVDLHQAGLTEMAEAERKLDAGTYGICTNCGNEISEHRLEALPFATLCIDCAEQLERTEVHGRGPTL
jgi:DnaK suppressor protein